MSVGIEGCQLFRQQLTEAVEGHDSGKCVDTNELRFADFFAGQARENMGKHGLIEKTRIEPQDDTRIRRGVRQFLVLITQRLQNVIPVQTAGGKFLQKQRTSAERIFTGLTRFPWAIIEDVVPDEHFSGNAGLRKNIPGTVAAGDMKGPVHGYPLLSSAAGGIFIFQFKRHKNAVWIRDVIRKRPATGETEFFI